MEQQNAVFGFASADKYAGQDHDFWLHDKWAHGYFCQNSTEPSSAVFTGPQNSGFVQIKATYCQQISFEKEKTVAYHYYYLPPTPTTP